MTSLKFKLQIIDPTEILLPWCVSTDVNYNSYTHFHSEWDFCFVMDYYAWISKLLRNVAFAWRPRELSCLFYKWLISGNLAIWTFHLLKSAVCGPKRGGHFFYSHEVVLVPSLSIFFMCKVGKRVELVLFLVFLNLKLFTAWIFW